LVRFNPAAFMIEASVTMPRPMMNATTGLAWCAGTSSAGRRSRTAEGVGDDIEPDVAAAKTLLEFIAFTEQGKQKNIDDNQTNTRLSLLRWRWDEE
jgi:hypothetical protein